ncbi:MAG: DEAD/DEAH box helicase [Spirochaetales bacterium]|nr:DEAD/DEAH box helicase [Spirochaetales bacterium]
MVGELVDELRDDGAFLEHVSHWETIPAREGVYAPIPDSVDERIVAALKRRGIDRLYSHQSEVIAHAHAGRNVVVVTPTASGKTLCYNLPVLDAVLKDPDARALYLFPTKALSQDQQAELNMTVGEGGLEVAVMTYDGDTPPAVRSSARRRGRIIISNPDMLHAGILPNHTKWVQFFQNLRYIVIDELHVYRGIFGSHVCNVIRRLKRIAAFYGSHPQFILCSATIGNPKELAEAVIEESVEAVDRNGAPAGEKHLVLYNPPLVDRVQGIRQGIVHASRLLALRFLRRGIKTIVFARSRQRTELIASYIRSSLRNVYNADEGIRVESYRGGYLPTERRAIEKGLRDGTIHGVVSTNALELGIDIGGLDAAILGGFPGTVASSLQQAGRAGRRRSVSLAVLVANSSPLDQFVVDHPEYFLERSPESAYINPDNPFVLFDQLKSAVFELPMRIDEPFAPGVEDMLAVLEENGVIRRSGETYHWSDQSYPAEQTSLRSATTDNVVIVDVTDGADRVIGEMDRPSAKELLFDNAIYIHRGEQYVVKRLDIDNRRCTVERTDVNYFTDALVKLDVKVLTEDERREVAGVEVIVGDILARSIVAKFKKIRFQSHENVGYGDISLPEEQMHTRSAMIILRPGRAPRMVYDALPAPARPVALARLARLLRDVAPVYLMSVGRDLGVHHTVRDPHFGEPALYLYDRYPGGSGLSDALARLLPDIIAAADERVLGCGCSSGCPSCVGPVDAGDGWEGSPKEAVAALLAAWREIPRRGDEAGGGSLR